MIQHDPKTGLTTFTDYPIQITLRIQAGLWSNPAPAAEQKEAAELFLESLGIVEVEGLRIEFLSK